jgi:hypothetical protein
MNPMTFDTWCRDHTVHARRDVHILELSNNPSEGKARERGIKAELARNLAEHLVHTQLKKIQDGYVIHYQLDLLIVSQQELARFIFDEALELSQRFNLQYPTTPRPGGEDDTRPV